MRFIIAGSAHVTTLEFSVTIKSGIILGDRLNRAAFARLHYQLQHRTAACCNVKILSKLNSKSKQVKMFYFYVFPVEVWSFKSLFPVIIFSFVSKSKKSRLSHKPDKVDLINRGEFLWQRGKCRVCSYQFHIWYVPYLRTISRKIPFFRPFTQFALTSIYLRSLVSLCQQCFACLDCFVFLHYFLYMESFGKECCDVPLRTKALC